MEPMPKEIAGAICKVMGGISKLPKADRNQHGGYNFASIDAFLAAVNPLCADAGLFIMQDETAMEILPPANGQKAGQLHMQFAFMVGHSSGQVWGPVSRSVMVPATGAQAFGSAQSYAQKQFMRSLFMIATGDKDDPDFQQADTLPSRARQQQPRQQAAAPAPQPVSTDAWWRKRFAVLTDPASDPTRLEKARLQINAQNQCKRPDNGLDAAQAVNWLLAGIAAAKTVEELTALDECNKGALNLLNNMGEEGMMDAGRVRKAMGERFQALSPAEAAE